MSPTPHATTRRCYISLIGSPRQVAEALYISALPVPGSDRGDRSMIREFDPPFGADRYEATNLEAHRQPLLSPWAIHLRPAYGDIQGFMEQNYGATDNRQIDPVFALDVNGILEIAPGKKRTLSQRAHIVDLPTHDSRA